MSDMAIAYPIKVFPGVVGLAEEGRENLLRYGNAGFNIFGRPNRLFNEALEILPAVGAWIMEHCKRDTLAPGSIGQLIYEGAEQGDVSPDEAGLLVRSLLSAGIDTTVSGIGNMLKLFAEHPEQWALLRSDPSLINLAFEEAIRAEGPVQAFFRTSSMATELSGVPVGVNEKLILFRAQPIATQGAGIIPTGLILRANRPAISLGVTAFTAASACASRRWRPRPS